MIRRARDAIVLWLVVVYGWEILTGLLRLWVSRRAPQPRADLAAVLRDFD